MGAPRQSRVSHVVLLFLVPCLLALLGGCRGAEPPAAAPSGSPSRAPEVLGGRLPPRRDPPRAPMDRLEKAVAARLGQQVARQGLDLDYLDCRHWTGAVPARLSCRGYLDGLVARVRVLLSAGAPGHAIGFDARLGHGVIATSRLEQTLRREGWRAVDCGRAAAYPSRVGSTIRCRGTRAGSTHDVVAEVRSRSGAVALTEDD